MNKLTTDRKFWLILLLTIVTLGFYQWYLVHAFAKETNIVCKEDGKKTPSLTTYVLLSIITLGIYAIVWRCMWIKRCNSYLRQNGKPEGLRIPTYLSIVLGYLLFYVVSIFAYDFYISSNTSYDALSDVSLYLESSNIVFIGRLLSCAQLILWLICWIIIIYKQLYLQNAVNSTYNKIKAHSKKEWLNDYLQNAVKNTRNDSIDETYDNLAETQSTKELANINNKIQPSIPPSVKRYRTIATIFTVLAVIVSIVNVLISRYWYNIGITFETFSTINAELWLAKNLFIIIILFSLLKISANKATRNAVIIIFATIIFHPLLNYLSNLFPYKIGYWIFHYSYILYYLSISYAVSIILRNNRFVEDGVKKTWLALLPLLWICLGRVLLWYFPVILIPACFYAIHSSAFSGPSEEETLTTKPYAAINRYTIASLIICILVYLANTYFIIEHYRETAQYYM